MSDREKERAAGVSVLPPIDEKPKIDAPANPDELLNEEQRTELQADLERMARLRREAEVSSANLKMA